MQAGEKLEFVKPFEGFAEVEITPEIKEDDPVVDMFLDLCAVALRKHMDSIERMEVYADGEFLTAFESVLRINADDGSYLHAVVFGHHTDEGVTDMGITLSEHKEDGEFLGGYKYSYDTDGLTRYNVPVEVRTEEDGPLDLEVDRTHFSVIETHRMIQELMSLELSEDDEERDMAQQVRKEYDEYASFETWTAELGYDGQAPDLEEITALVTLLDSATPLKVEGLYE